MYKPVKAETYANELRKTTAIPARTHGINVLNRFRFHVEIYKDKNGNSNFE